MGAKSAQIRKHNTPLPLFLFVVATFALFAADRQTAWAAAAPNDYYYSNQSHLKQIKADKAWETIKGNPSITIAVLDTGVDSNHPDLKGNLLPGVNLVNPGKPPVDDNGHGTAVAGIIAAKGNNRIGVAGVMWSARILPIKVLDKYAESDDVSTVARGIHIAVDRGAKIIVMSLSILTNSPSLEEAVRYAEEKGVIVVAASGNEGSRVAYPAAYPTVIAVGAVNGSNKPLYQSNLGPELKLMAPGWNVYTTKMGGTYGAISGTSAAAPQVAAAAGLVLAQRPHLTPLEVRQLLYYTAADLGPKGWDKETGYGLLDVSRAVHTVLPADINEPNNSQSRATPFPIESQARGELSPKDQVDWFYTDVPYDGKVTFRTWVSTGTVAPIAATFFSEDRSPVTYYISSGGTLTVPLRAGRVYYKLERVGIPSVRYVLTSRFTINPDRYEKNDTLETARPLPPGNRVSIEGNFHTRGDEDWFSYYVRDPGKLNLSVTTDTLRIDPVLFVEKLGGSWETFDDGTRENPAERANLDVSPGKYLIRLSDYNHNQVNGVYRLDLTYTPERKDDNEPNDTSRLATRLGNGTLMTGTISSRSDNDWFQFQIPSDSYVTIRAPYVPVSSGVKLTLYSETNYVLVAEDEVAQLSAKGRPIAAMKLSAGTYYVRITSTVPFKYDTYRLTVTREKLVDGYRDISNHWARYPIARLSRAGIVNGFEDYTFRPNQPVTRAQFAAMLIRAMNRKGLYTGTTGAVHFADLKRSHWAYTSIVQAARLGILQGYPNHTVRPNAPVTRAEMAAMVARAKKLLLYPRGYSSYVDVSTGYWASPAIESLTSYGYVNGYRDGTYRPQANALRGEVVVLLAKVFDL